ncbi:MAG: helical backbone metal receptor [Acidimicrobiales bacterium]
MKVVSLVPSVTETLAAWGVDPVACTRFCERDDLVTVGGTKDPDVGAIAALGPDLVVVDAEENRHEDYIALVDAGLAVHVLHVRSLADVGPALDGLAERVGVDWAAPRLPPSVPLWRSAFVPIWRRPWMALGLPTYGGSLLRHLGIESVFASDGPYATTTLDEAAARHPDLVLAPSEPYPFTTRQLPELETVGPTVFVDGKDLFWWGTRTGDAVVRLAAVLDRSGG